MKRLLVLALFLPLLAAGCQDALNNTTNNTNSPTNNGTNGTNQTGNPGANNSTNTQNGTNSADDDSNDDGTSSNQSNDDDSNQNSQGRNYINLSGDESDRLITISQVVLEKPGFVVIHQDNNGSPGRVLFWSKLINNSTDEDIKLPAQITAGRSYWATLHFDNGDGVFQETSDPMAKFNDQTPVQVKFTTRQASATSADKSDDDSKDDSPDSSSDDSSDSLYGS